MTTYANKVIAAIALQHGLTLVTGNTAHYERVKALGYALDIVPLGTISSAFMCRLNNMFPIRQTHWKR